MNNLYFESELAAVSAVGTMDAVGSPSPRTPGMISSRATSGRILDRARSWCQRLLEIAAHNPPHLL